MNGLTVRCGFFFAIHTGLAVWAALDWSTTAWALLKRHWFDRQFYFVSCHRGFPLKKGRFKTESRMRLLILLLYIALLSACSRSEVMVEFFDSVATSKADDYFDLSSQQKSELKKDLQNDLDKARRELFPEVAKTLRSMEKEVQKDKLNAEFVSARYNDFQNYYKRLSGYFSDSSTKLVLSLQPAQFDYFADQVRKDIKKNDLEEAERDVLKRYRRSLEFWIGGLSADQKKNFDSF